MQETHIYSLHNYKHVNGLENMRGKQNNENQLYGKFRKYTSSPNTSSSKAKDMSKQPQEL